MEKRKVFDEEKMYEYTEILKVIKKTVPQEELAQVCLNNKTLRTLAGYEGTCNEDDINLYVKDFLDKLSFDEHNKKVEEAKEKKDNVELQRLSDEMMAMAGYTDDSEGSYNEYARTFVDKTLFDKQLRRITKAVKAGRLDIVEESYKRIESMTSHNPERVYNVPNPFAQTFVDNGYVGIYTNGKFLGTMKKAVEQPGIAI